MKPHRTIILAIGIMTICLTAVQAKRVAPSKVTPVVHDGLEYRAPLDASKIGIVEAWDTKQGKKRWQKKIYTTLYDEQLERDVQWIFIKSLKVAKGQIIVTDERGRSWSLDPTTKKVLALGKPGK